VRWFCASNKQLAGVFIARVAIISIAFSATDLHAQPKTPAAQKPASAASGAAAPASAASAPKPPAQPVQSEYRYEKLVKDAGGKEKLEPLGALQPGDVIVYTATHRNVSAQGLVNVDMGVAIPPGTSYITGSANPADGRLVKQPNGQKQIMWNVPVFEAGSSLVLTIRVQLAPSATAAPSPAASSATKAASASAPAPPKGGASSAEKAASAP
jgi:uncharacterized repeat protein (TIGR01451 family)